MKTILTSIISILSLVSCGQIQKIENESAAENSQGQESDGLSATRSQCRGCSGAPWDVVFEVRQSFRGRNGELRDTDLPLRGTRYFLVTLTHLQDGIRPVPDSKTVWASDQADGAGRFTTSIFSQTSTYVEFRKQCLLIGIPKIGDAPHICGAREYQQITGQKDGPVVNLSGPSCDRVFPLGRQGTYTSKQYVDCLNQVF